MCRVAALIRSAHNGWNCRAGNALVGIGIGSRGFQQPILGPCAESQLDIYGMALCLKLTCRGHGIYPFSRAARTPFQEPSAFLVPNPVNPPRSRRGALLWRATSTEWVLHIGLEGI